MQTWRGVAWVAGVRGLGPAFWRPGGLRLSDSIPCPFSLTMVTQALRKRRKDGSVFFFLAFILGCLALMTLPGFLYFFFWEKAGWVVSSLIGFLLGSFALSVLEGLGAVAQACRRVRDRRVKK